MNTLKCIAITITSLTLTCCTEKSPALEPTTGQVRKPSITTLTPTKEQVHKSSIEAIKATSDDDKWEYLVISFGKARFSDINESIQNKSSKLVAFQEFSDLLSGHEAIDLQYKLDLLGRFGWELTTTLGNVGSDQQQILKRKRKEDRIEKEQKALEKLSEILREEQRIKKEQLEKFLLKLELSKKGKKDEGLIELDEKEKRDREQNARDELILNLKTWLIDENLPLLPGTALIKKTISADASSESIKSKLTYTSSIKFDVDATNFLLTNKNQYRKSEAIKLAEKQLQSILKLFPGRSDKISYSNNFTLYINLYIDHNNKLHEIGDTYKKFKVKGYPSPF